MKHKFTLTRPPENTPCIGMPDGAYCGNGDVAVVWSGTTFRIKLHISKADFWAADGNAKREPLGGISPLGIIEILLPQFHDVPYCVEQDMDGGVLTGYFKNGNFDAKLSVRVCAVSNTILIELDRSFPGLSVSVNPVALNENGAAAESGTSGELKWCTRSFETPELTFQSHGICVLKQVSRRRQNDREIIRWAVTVATNHDSACFKEKATNEALSLDDDLFDRMIDGHNAWWRDFWNKCNISLSDKTLELHWYSGLYALACCMGNDSFPPGLWGILATQDGMQWQGDYHMNYNFEAPYYPVAAANHPELIKGYMAALNAFIPKGRRYASEFLGCRGIFYPVGIGPLGHETDIWPTTKEHGHLFLGQKSNAAYGAVIPMMHWYSTRDTEFAKKHYYNYLREAGLFWEDYLVEYDGKYHIRNDALFEASFWNGMSPKGYDAKDPIISLGLVKMLMKLLCDIASELDVDTDCIPKWKDIAERIAEPETYEEDGVVLLRGRSGDDSLFRQVLEYIYPVDGTGMYENPRLMKAAKNSLEKLDSWDHSNTFCSYYPSAVILGMDYDTIVTHLKDCIENHHLGNGLFRFEGGGLENNAAVPSTINEMLLGSREGVIKLFPCMKLKSASFNGLRAYGAFIVNASLKDGIIEAEIVSEKGQRLKIEKPDDGYILICRGEEISLCDKVTEVETMLGEKLYVRKK